MTQQIPTVTIVGRTNVGKSSLFNALAKRRLAIVEDDPGVTRDRNYALIAHYGSPFTLVDTGGLVGEEDLDTAPEIREGVHRQAEVAIEQADVVVALFDGISGPQPLDKEVIDILRRSGKRVIWAVNKCESPNTRVLAAEFYALGVEELLFVSAAHRIGLTELTEAIGELIGDVEYERTDESNTIKVAVLGRPNVGKSTLTNKILGEERLVVSPVPGTTRDSIDTELVRDGRKFLLIDTAGLRKKARVSPDTLERFGNLRTLRALARCDVAVLVLDATQGLPAEQEQKVAKLINERGRGLVLVVNKWDAIEKDHRTVREFGQAVYGLLHFVSYAPIVFVSALTGRRCPSVLKEVERVYESSHTRVRTSDLNRVLDQAFKRNPPPVYRGEPVKLFFATQTEVAPPTIVAFVNYPRELRPSYIRYLKTQIREHFPFEGSDIKLILRKRTSKAAGEEDAGRSA